MYPDWNMGYQYQWRTLTDSDAYLALGLQGQYIYIDPGAKSGSRAKHELCPARKSQSITSIAHNCFPFSSDTMKQHCFCK